MELSKLNPRTLPPSQTNHQHDAVSIHSLRRNNIRVISYLVILAVVFYIATVYTFSPSDSHISTIQLMLNHVSVHVGSQSTLDVSLNAKVKVKNKVMYSLDSTTLHLEVGYNKGKGVGNMMAFGEGGHVSVVGSSYVETTVQIDGVAVDSDDLAKGLIEFDIVAHVDGFLSFMQLPLKAKYSCNIDVDIKEQRITRQICYPMAIEVGFSFTLPIPFVPSGQLLFHFALIF